MVARPRDAQADLSIHPNNAMRAHPFEADSDRMPANHRGVGDQEPPGYEIRVRGIRDRGSIGPTMMQAFPTLTVSRSGEDTLLSGSLPDQSALYGVIHELEALGLELLEIRPLPAGDAGRPAGSTRGYSPS